MFSDRPSRRHLFRGLLGTLCVWPLLRRAATTAAEPAATAPIAHPVEFQPGRWEYAYDGNNRLLSSVTAYACDGSVTWETDPPGHVTIYVYDGPGRRYPHRPA